MNKSDILNNNEYICMEYFKTSMSRLKDFVLCLPIEYLKRTLALQLSVARTIEQSVPNDVWVYILQLVHHDYHHSTCTCWVKRKARAERFGIVTSRELYESKYNLDEALEKEQEQNIENDDEDMSNGSDIVKYIIAVDWMMKNKLLNVSQDLKEYWRVHFEPVKMIFNNRISKMICSRK